MNRENIAELVIRNVADVFEKSESEIATNLELNYNADLFATSMQYYPIISELEDALDIELDIHQFQDIGSTINKSIDFVWSEYQRQHP